MNDVKLTLLNFINRVIRPDHWTKLYGYSRSRDQWLLRQIEEDTYKPNGYFTVILGGKKVWVHNYPYAYGYLYDIEKGHCGSYVAIKLKNYLDRKVYET